MCGVPPVSVEPFDPFPSFLKTNSLPRGVIATTHMVGFAIGGKYDILSTMLPPSVRNWGGSDFYIWEFIELHFESDD